MRALPFAALLCLATGDGAATAAGPMRRFVLSGGDTFCAELLSLDDRRVILRSRFGSRHELSRGQCVSIAQPEGLVDFDARHAAGRGFWTKAEADLAWTTDDGRSVVDASPPFVMRADTSDASIARIAFGWHVPADDPGDAPSVRLSLDLSFADEKEATDLTIAVPVGESPPVQVRGHPTGLLPCDVTPRPHRTGWRDVVLLVHAGRLRVLLDGEICVSGAAPRGELKWIALRTERIPRAANPVAAGWRISEPQLQRLDRSGAGHGRDFTSSDPTVDTGFLASGDEVMGRVAAADGAAVQLVAADRTTLIPWSDLRGIAFAAKAEATPAVSGMRARVELVPLSGHLPQKPDVLTGAILAESRETLSISHPVLGRVALPLNQVRRIKRLGRGTLQVLDGSVHHLGDEVRSGFRRPRPEGVSQAGTFPSNAIPAGSRGWLCFEVVDVEPCGPDAPRGTPFLADLRAGFLRTEVTLNGTPLGDLNSHLTYKAAPAGPQRIRIPFRTDLLKAGENAWRLKQRPARGDEASFDDCEIGPVTLEIDFPEPAAESAARQTEASP